MAAVALKAGGQRADAWQNRTRILAAAEVVFQDHGVDAPLDVIIREAGVGRSTFFRHFRDRQSLLAALLDRATDELEEFAGQMRGRPDGLHRIMSYLVERIGVRAAFVAHWNAVNSDHPAVRGSFARVEPIFADAIARARDAGLCRADLTGGELIALGRMLASAVNDAPTADRPQVARRIGQLLLEGYQAQR